MESFFIEYRDPLFGIIVFFLLIFVIALVSYVWNSYSSRRQEERIRKFAKKFEYAGLDEEVEWVLSVDKKPIKSLLNLAYAYGSSGDHQRAIRIYLTLMDSLDKPKDKLDVMELLGESYFKAGFLQRSRDIFLEVLRNYPRNSKALTYLVFVYDNLNEYERAFEALEPLEEMGEDVQRSRYYFEAQRVLHDPLIKASEKSAKLIELVQTEKRLQHIVFQYLLENDSELFWEYIGDVEHEALMDLFWRVEKEKVPLDIIANFKLLKEIYSAKGIPALAENSAIFELSVLISLNKCGNVRGDLGFEYVCGECKQIFPLYQGRCPNCMSIMSLEAVPMLCESRHEASHSLQ